MGRWGEDEVHKHWEGLTARQTKENENKELKKEVENLRQEVDNLKNQVSSKISNEKQVIW